MRPLDSSEAEKLYESFSGHKAKWVEQWFVPSCLNAPKVLVKVGGLLRVEAGGRGVSFDSRSWSLATGENGKGLFLLGLFDSREIGPAFGVNASKLSRLPLEAIGYQARRDGSQGRFLHRFEVLPVLVIDGKNKCLRIEGGDFLFTEKGIEG